MLLSISSIFIVLVLTFLALSKWRSIGLKAAEDAFAVQQGCLPVKAVLRGRLPLGLDLITGLVRANAGQRLMHFLQPFIDQSGPNLELRLLGNSGLVTTDPENIRAVLSKSTFRGELDFVFGERREALLPLFGEGIFTQEGLPWKRSREILRKQFARIHYQNMEVFTEHIELLVKRVARLRGSTIDLQPLLFNFTLDTSTSLLFGYSAGSLREESQDEFGKNLNIASWYSAIRVQLDHLYWLCSLPQYFRACAKVKEYADLWVKEALDGPNDGSEGSVRYDFIRNLYEELQDRRLVREQLVNVLLAGRDTTGCLLSWTFRLLVRHPNVLQRLRKEIEFVQNGNTSITKSKLQEMPYLSSVMTETLRLYPPVPVNFRYAQHATILPRGGGPDGSAPLLVRKKMGVGYAPYFMHRRQDLYGDDALCFRPERWEDGSLHKRVGWAYLPFNGGPRICLGQEFALLEASYAVVRIVQSFPELALPFDEKIEPIGAERQGLTLTLAPADGCKVRI